MSVLEEALPWEIQGHRASNSMLLDTLVYAVAEGTSLYGACTLLEGVADGTPLRDHLDAILPSSAFDSLSRRGKAIVLVPPRDSNPEPTD